MAQGIGRFTISSDGGEKRTVLASRLDYVIIERELKQPLYRSIEQGYLEPVLRLAYQACRRQEAIPGDVDFDAFLERYDVEFITEDDAEDEQGNG